MGLADLLPLYDRINKNTAGRYKYRHKHLISAFCILCFICLLVFNIQFTNNTAVSYHSNSTQSSHNYHIFIHSHAQFESRRRLIRKEYFGIHNNIITPCLDDTIQYKFLITDGHPSANTIERRSLETEKIEYNDIIELRNITLDNPRSLLQWVNLSLSGHTDIDYVIIQDIHSYMPMNQLISEIDHHKDRHIWGIDMDGIVIRSNKIESLAISYGDGSNDVLMRTLPYQEWKNNIKTLNTNHLLIKHVYQDDDFEAIKEEYDEHNRSTLIPMRTCDHSIAVVTSSYIYDKCMEPSANKAAINKRDYANKHGYAFVARSNEFKDQSIRNNKRRTVWGKIDIIQKVLPHYEWLLWMDMDAVVMNSEIGVEDLMNDLIMEYNESMDQVDFMIVRPGTDKMINAGVFLIKNTEWSYRFLDAIQNRTEWYNTGPSYEQGAMWDVIQEKEYKERVLFMDRNDHVFNTFPKYYQSGDFIVHFAPDKCPNDATLKGLSAAENIKKGKEVNSSELV